MSGTETLVPYIKEHEKVILEKGTDKYKCMFAQEIPGANIKELYGKMERALHRFHLEKIFPKLFLYEK